jgi:hypothetical protein
LVRTNENVTEYEVARECTNPDLARFAHEIVLTKDEALTVNSGLASVGPLLRSSGHVEAASWVDQVFEYLEDRISIRSPIAGYYAPKVPYVGVPEVS